jgi:hypothetical protein
MDDRFMVSVVTVVNLNLVNLVHISDSYCTDLFLVDGEMARRVAMMIVAVTMTMAMMMVSTSRPHTEQVDG